jgi:Lar family restriction alleviation protein
MKLILLPCPFCGSDQIRLRSEDRPDGQLYFTYCKQCGASTSGSAGTAVAKKRWNRRAYMRIAKELGRRGGLSGGLARSKSLSPEEGLK